MIKSYYAAAMLMLLPPILKRPRCSFPVSSTRDDDVAGDGGHDPPVLVVVAVPVVNVGDAALAVVGDPIHRVAAEAKPRDLGQAGSAQIMRRDALDPEFGDQLPQQQRPTLLALFGRTRWISISASAGSESATR